jgi:small subunit ribosomal protein S1
MPRRNAGAIKKQRRKIIMKNYQIGEIVTGRVVSVLPAAGFVNCAGSMKIKLADTTVTMPITELDGDLTESNNARHIARRYMGRTVIAKVTNTKPLEISIKEAIEEKLEKTTLKVGQEVAGTVVWVNRKHAEIEYNNCLIMVMPSTEYGYLRIGNLADVLKPGEKIAVEVTSITDETVFVSHKKYADNPWPSIQAKYCMRGQYLARVVKVIDIGVFVNLEPGLDVLAAPRPTFFDVKFGDEVALEITDLEPSTGKIKGIITTVVTVAAERRKKQIV